MLIRLSADQTDFFELSGADFFFVLLFQLVLVRLVALVLLVLVVLAPLILKVTTSSRPVIISSPMADIAKTNV